MTLLASAQGDLGFKTPEAFRELSFDSCASDVWSVGVTLYLLLTDEMPYPEAAGATPGKPLAYGRLVPAGSLNLAVDSTLDYILDRCLAVRATERYPTARELLADLEAWRPRSAQPPVQPAAARPAPASAPLREKVLVWDVKSNSSESKVMGRLLEERQADATGRDISIVLITNRTNTPAAMYRLGLHSIPGYRSGGFRPPLAFLDREPHPPSGASWP